MTDNNYYDSSPITPPASMVCTYQLYLLNRHLFVDLPEGRALVDTGAPYSASTTGRLTWQNRNHGVYRGGYLGFTFDQLSAEIGVQVDALLGMDLLAQTTLLFDVAHRTMTAGDEMPAGFVAHPYELAPTSDIPLFRVTLNGRPARALWDTGAQYGYVSAQRFTDGVAPRPGFTDFSPMFGDLKIPTAYTLPFTLAGHDLLETVGPAPEVRGGGVSPVAMGPFLRALDIDTIIGPSWMPRVKVWLNPLDQTFALAV